MRLDHPRVYPLPEAEWSNETREQLRTRPGAGETRPLNIFATLARHPKLLKRWMVFGSHVLSKSTLPARERELLILRTGRLCGSRYEVHQHTRIGLEAGLSLDEIKSVTFEGTNESADPSAHWSERDAALIRAADELHADQMLGDRTWNDLKKTWSEQQIMDLLFTVGQYTLVSMVLNTLGIQIEDTTAIP